MKTSIFLSSLIFVTTSARGEFTLIENFENLPVGPLGTQNDWVADPDYTVETDPTGTANLVLKYQFGAQGGAYLNLMTNAIDEGQSGTLFYRFRFDAEGNANTGFSDSTAPAAYGDYEAQINRQANTPLKGRDSGGFQDLNPADSVALADDPDIWYSIWLVTDNATDTSRIFIQSDDDPEFTTQTEMFVPDGMINYRNGTADQLITLALRSQQGIAYWDDFYVSPGLDLTNPAPTPAGGGELQVTSIEYLDGTSVELTWNALIDHEYSIEASGDLVTWAALDERVIADSGSASAELFEPDITPVDGRLFFRVLDLGVPAP